MYFIYVYYNNNPINILYWLCILCGTLCKTHWVETFSKVIFGGFYVIIFSSFPVSAWLCTLPAHAFACVFGCSQMTTLEDDVPRSEMLCMMAIPAAYTIHDLIQFTAPLK
jgi:hypothetical protein